LRIAIWLARPTITKAQMDRPKQADHSIEGIIPLLESAVNVSNEAILTLDAMLVSCNEWNRLDRSRCILSGVKTPKSQFWVADYRSGPLFDMVRC
jgi:hypothetical protein